jgi:hypothetical protein
MKPKFLADFRIFFDDPQNDYLLTRRKVEHWNFTNYVENVKRSADMIREEDIVGIRG